MNKYALILLLPAIMMGCSTQKRVPQSAYSTAGTIASAPATPHPLCRSYNTPIRFGPCYGRGYQSLRTGISC